MSVCNHGLISRIALADVSGHGRVVSAISKMLQKLMHENIDVWNQLDFMRGLNETFALSVQNKYATAIVRSNSIASRAGSGFTMPTLTAALVSCSPQKMGMA